MINKNMFVKALINYLNFFSTNLFFILKNKKIKLNPLCSLVIKYLILNILVRLSHYLN